MAEPSLTDSFMEVACCDSGTAQKYLQNNAGDMTKAMAKYFRDQEHRWDAARQRPRADGESPSREPQTQPGAVASTDVGSHPEKRGQTQEKDSRTLSPEKSKTHEKSVGKRPASAVDDDDELDHLDASLPWNKVKFGEPCRPGNAEEFSYEAVKTKVQMTNYAGPKEGSTWHWFLVADQQVFPTGDAAQPGPEGSTNGTNGVCIPMKEASTYISGDKFQAGWTQDPAEKVSATVMTNRKASMIESILQGKLNAYGKNRRGCKPGYSHRWTYADSEWAAADIKEAEESKMKPSVPLTTECFWDEQKNEDRWLVSIQMRWAAPTACILPGAYVIVADQIASKMNKNQYSTAMRGRRFRLGPVDAPPEQLATAKEALLASVLREMRPAKLAAAPKKKQKLAA